MIDAEQLNRLDARQLRAAVVSLMSRLASQQAEISRRERELAFKQTIIDKLTHEMAVLKRLKFAARSEAFDAGQKSLLEESIDAELEALAREIEQLAPAPADKGQKHQPKRQALPAHLPRREHRHETDSATCACGCRLRRIGKGRGREARLRARGVHRRAPDPRQMGTRAVRDLGDASLATRLSPTRNQILIGTQDMLLSRAFMPLSIESG